MDNFLGVGHLLRVYPRFLGCLGWDLTNYLLLKICYVGEGGFVS